MILYACIINSAKKVRKHCIDEGIFQCRFVVEKQGIYQKNDESIRKHLAPFLTELSKGHQSDMV